jgi:glycosyltransferase involved in cell wall biosynthesis
VFKDKRITIVPNYPERSWFSKEAVLKKVSSLGKGSDIVFAYIGTLNLDFDRDTRLMFSMIEKLLKADGRIRFVLAGRTYGEEIVKIIERLEKEYGERVRYLGELSMDVVVEQTQNAHFGLLLIRPESPVWSESRPLSANKVYEYMMGGAIPIIRAIIDDSESVASNSLIFGKDSGLDDICSKILEIMSDEERMRSMMQQSYETGMTFSWENVSTRYLECYDRLFGTKENGTE